jgi:hypothetical protein
MTIMMENGMLKKIGYGLTAVAIVLACSMDVQAQQRANYNNVQVNRVTNVYGGGGYGYRGYGWNNNVGMWPGSGPYDSAIAVAGIAAGASVVNNIINSATINRQPPQQVIINQAPPVYAPQQVVVGQPVGVVGQPYYGGPTCQIFITGYSPSGDPVTIRSCR